MTVNHDVAGSSPAGGARKKTVFDGLFSMKRTLRCMKNEAAYGYEAWLRHTEKSSLRFASYERMRVHRGNEVAASYLRSKCFIDKTTIFSGVSMTVPTAPPTPPDSLASPGGFELTTVCFCAIIKSRKAVK